MCRISEADTVFDTTIGHIEDIIMGMRESVCIYAKREFVINDSFFTCCVTQNCLPMY